MPQQQRFVGITETVNYKNYSRDYIKTKQSMITMRMRLFVPGRDAQLVLSVSDSVK